MYILLTFWDKKTPSESIISKNIFNIKKKNQQFITSSNVFDSRILSIAFHLVANHIQLGQMKKQCYKKVLKNSSKSVSKVNLKMINSTAYGSYAIVANLILFSPFTI